MARLFTTTQDDVVQLGGVDAAALDGFLDYQGRQVGGGHAPQPSAKGGHRGAYG